MTSVLSGLANRVAELCSSLCEAALVLLALMIAGGVVMRNLFGLSFSGVEILSSYTLVVLTFLGGTAALAAGAVYRMTLIDDLIGGRTAAAVALVVHAAAAAVLLVIALYSWELVASSYARGVVFQANQSIPLWLLQLAVPVGSLTMTLMILSSAGVRLRELATSAALAHPAIDPAESGE